MTVWVILEGGLVESVWGKEREARDHLAELELSSPDIEFRLVASVVRW